MNDKPNGFLIITPDGVSTAADYAKRIGVDMAVGKMQSKTIIFDYTDLMDSSEKRFKRNPNVGGHKPLTLKAFSEAIRSAMIKETHEYNKEVNAEYEVIEKKPEPKLLNP